MGGWSFGVSEGGDEDGYLAARRREKTQKGRWRPEFWGANVIAAEAGDGEVLKDAKFDEFHDIGLEISGV